MISVGIDVSKEKSMIAILKPFGEVVRKPFIISHTSSDLASLITLLLSFDDEIKIVLEATGSYHLPILLKLKEHGFFISLINPLLMKRYINNSLRKAKTDKIDSLKIAEFGIDNWYKLSNFQLQDDAYIQLKYLGRQYAHYMKLHIESKLALTNILDYTMPGIKSMFNNTSIHNSNNKLLNFVEKYWHFDNITKFSQTRFIDEYNKWAIKKGHHQSVNKPIEIYLLAKDGIPTMSSKSKPTKLMVLEAIRVLRTIDSTLINILSQMEEIAKTLAEYNLIMSMEGVGKSLAVRIIGEIGDIKKFTSKKALIAYAGIDAPPYQSGKYSATNRRISKRGSSLLRKIGYEIMMSIKAHKNDGEIYKYILKKETEGKARKVAKIAGLNKFLRIYYARVNELYSTN